MSGVGRSGWTTWAAYTAGLGVVAGWLSGTTAPVFTALLAFGGAILLLRPELYSGQQLAEELDAGRDPGLLELDEVHQRIAKRVVDLERRVEDRSEAARELADRMQEVIEAAPAGIAILEASGRIVRCNQRLVELLSPRLDPIGRQTIEAFSFVELHDQAQAALAGQALEPVECAAGDRDVSIEGCPLSEGAMLVVRDVSRFRRAERARTDFVANVSHELRTPVAAIIGYAEALVEDSDRLPEDLAPMAEIIHRNGRRLSRLFDELLELHRIEARRRQLPREHLTLHLVLARAVEVGADRAAMKSQDFSLECPEGLTAWTNREGLSAIVANLVSNACKYTPEGGSIRVSAQADESGVRIDVADSGVGIPKEHQQRIFERFYRVDDGRSRAVGGAGLGLAIVKHLALASGCQLTLTSNEGSGSVFTVHLPAREDDVASSRTWDATL